MAAFLLQPDPRDIIKQAFGMASTAFRGYLQIVGHPCQGSGLQTFSVRFEIDLERAGKPMQVQFLATSEALHMSSFW